MLTEGSSANLEMSHACARADQELVEFPPSFARKSFQALFHNDSIRSSSCERAGIVFGLRCLLVRIYTVSGVYPVHRKPITWISSDRSAILTEPRLHTELSLCSDRISRHVGDWMKNERGGRLHANRASPRLLGDFCHLLVEATCLAKTSCPSLTAQL